MTHDSLTTQDLLAPFSFGHDSHGKESAKKGEHDTAKGPENKDLAALHCIPCIMQHMVSFSRIVDLYYTEMFCVHWRCQGVFPTCQL